METRSNYHGISLVPSEVPSAERREKEEERKRERKRGRKGGRKEENIICSKLVFIGFVPWKHFLLPRSIDTLL